MILLTTRFLFLAAIILSNCALDDDNKKPIVDTDEIRSLVDSLTYRNGVLIYSGDQGKKYWTEFNTSLRTIESTRITLERKNNLTFLKCSFNELKENNFSGLKLSVYKTEFDNEALPHEIAQSLNGVSFNAMGYDGPVALTVNAVDVSEQIFDTFKFRLSEDTFRTFHCPIVNKKLKRLDFIVTHTDQTHNSFNIPTAFAIDDVYLKTGTTTPFIPPSDDEALLQWLKNSSIHFFTCNFKEWNTGQGIVTESWANQKRISLSGIGYAYAVFLIAGKDGAISAEEAKRKITAMINWQYQQNWYDGSAGWHGFPHHYFSLSGAGFKADVSTIDWAICAAGLRAVRQFYIDDTELASKIEVLLARPDWSAALDSENRIAMGFDATTGKRNDFRWGLAFSEETELVYLEAVASGLSAEIFKAIIREKKDGFYPSWFGSGFTYNWLQLWTGIQEPYKFNSAKAFDEDMKTCVSQFGKPLIGLTACQTTSGIDADGFLQWDRYIGNQGSHSHGTATSSEVIQVSPAPYGAMLALPFNRRNALAALREFVALGYYHSYLGLPDNVRLKNLPEGATMSPYWDTYDINVGPQVLAIEQTEDNLIGQLFMKDAKISAGLNALKASFTY